MFNWSKQFRRSYKKLSDQICLMNAQIQKLPLEYFLVKIENDFAWVTCKLEVKCGIDIYIYIHSVFHL